VALLAVMAGLGILIHGLGTAAEQRRARRQLPPGGQGKTQTVVPPMEVARSEDQLDYGDRYCPVTFAQARGTGPCFVLFTAT
jgi:hypothetical protein